MTNFLSKLFSQGSKSINSSLRFIKTLDSSDAVLTVVTTVFLVVVITIGINFLVGDVMKIFLKKAVFEDAVVVGII